ncbi:MAG: ComEC/Rec2 family competence protein [Tannerellaceae bacterium]|jgi:competence protein ComEC|nr:ComEC/Rec2 family competence protein [Tannerellaceae bacterium]
MTQPSSLPPFLRPLLIWIAGILIHTNFRPGACSFILLLPPLALLIGSAWLSESCGGAGRACRSSGRLWGIAFGCMLLFAAIQTAALHEARLSAAEGTPTWSRRWAEQTRAKLAEPVSSLNMSDDAKAFLIAITIGSREGMSSNLRRSFSAAGAAHILVVSGFHVGVLCSCVSLLLSFLSNRLTGRIIRFLLTMTAVWTFALVTGLAPPTMRAALTISLSLCAKLAGRSSKGFNNLCAAAFIALVCFPYDLFSLGFQLSYIAVAGIIFLQPRIFSLIEVQNPILRIPWESISLSLAAQAGVSFLCIYYFGQLSTVFILTNLYVGLLALVLIPAAMLWMLLPGRFALQQAVGRGLEILSENIVWTIDRLARAPGATLNLSLSKGLTLFCYASLLLSLYFFSAKTKL